MDLLRNLSLRMKLMLSFGFLNILIIVTSGFAVINTSKNIDASYNVERILGKSYSRVMNTQRALDKANDVIVSYLNGKATHDHNEAFIADSVGKIEEIAKVSSVMNENIIGDLPSTESYKNNILTVKNRQVNLLQTTNRKLFPWWLQTSSQRLLMCISTRYCQSQTDVLSCIRS